jgi:hypothetical protein
MIREHARHPGQQVTGVLGEERAWARSWRDTNRLAQTSLGEEKERPPQSLRDCTRDEAASESTLAGVPRVQRDAWALRFPAKRVVAPETLA